MFKIGDFSRLSRVSVKMLRHYDDIGLLKPAAVDPYTDYRYYTADQLPRLNRIIALKDLGLTLEQIARVIDGDLTASEIRGMLKLKRAELEQRVKREQATLARVEARLAMIDQERATAEYDVIVRTVAPQLVASIRTDVMNDGSDPVAALFDEVEVFAARHKARAAQPPLIIVHGEEYTDRGVDLEIAVPLLASIAPSERVNVHKLPGVDEMACAIHTGDYDTIHRAYDSLTTWMQAHEVRAAGPYREVYLRFGATPTRGISPAFLTNDARAFVTEVQCPVQPISRRG